MGKFSALFARFQRITSSGSFIPEIDGLRFVAIFAVVIFHVSHYLLAANSFEYTAAGDGFKQSIAFADSGSRGVQLFFVISGFILALPFANRYLLSGKAISLKKFYIRRLTRLEPPYILAMLICFLLIIKSNRFEDYLPSFIAAIFYCHNFIWPREVLPLVNPVAWSLEIEVQFYLLAPLFAKIFILRRSWRRAILLALILSKCLFGSALTLPHRSLIDFYEFFLAGFLLADLYVEGQMNIARSEWLPIAIGLISFAGIWLGPGQMLPLTVGLFIYCSFKSRLLRIPLSNRLVTSIGGMCYSIYLIHWMLITTLGGRIMFKITDSYAVDFLIHGALLSLLILIAGAIYFQLVERPCMKRDWPQRLFARVKAFGKPVVARGGSV